MTKESQEPPHEVRLTREELYEQVWSIPMVQLARRYGISDVGLAKTCRRVSIPRPGAGYWAKVQHGHKARRKPLPPAKTQEERVFVFISGPRQPPRAISADDPVAVAEHTADQRVVVPETLRSIHPLLRETARLLQEKKHRDTYGAVEAYGPGTFNVRVSPSTVHRALRILDALLRAFDERAYLAKPSTRDPGDYGHRNAAKVVVEGEAIEFYLFERATRTERVRDPIELLRYKRLGITPMKEHEYTPSGKLSLRIGQDYSYRDTGFRRQWSDTATCRLEECLNEFLISLVAASRVEQERTRRREEAERIRQEAHRQYLLQEEQRRAEEARVKALLDATDAWVRSRQIREYVAAVREAAREAPAGGDLSSWLAWAEAYAQRLDPLSRKPVD